MRLKPWKLWVAAAVLVCSAATGTVVAVATGTRAKQSPTEHFAISWTLSHYMGVAHGPIVGTGKVDVSAQKQVLHLGGGTVTLHLPSGDLHAKGGINPKTCFANFTISNNYTIENGTGKYRGVSGKGTLRGTEQAVLARDKKGTCDNDNFRGLTAYFRAQGPITLKG